MTVRIVTDSACDLPPQVAAEYGITVVPLYINFHGRGYLDGADLTRADFYARLPDLTPPPTTAALGADTFDKVYRRLVAEGASAILSIHIGSALSNVLNVAASAAAAIDDVPARAVDGGEVSLGTGVPIRLEGEVAPVIGAHVGPRAVGIVCVQARRA